MSPSSFWKDLVLVDEAVNQIATELKAGKCQESGQPSHNMEFNNLWSSLFFISVVACSDLRPMVVWLDWHWNQKKIKFYLTINRKVLFVRPNSFHSLIGWSWTKKLTRFWWQHESCLETGKFVPFYKIPFLTTPTIWDCMTFTHQLLF